MIGCLRTRVRKQPIIALHFEFYRVHCTHSALYLQLCFVLFTASHEIDHEKFIIMKKKLKEEMRIKARVKFIVFDNIKLNRITKLFLMPTKNMLIN